MLLLSAAISGRRNVSADLLLEYHFTQCNASREREKVLKNENKNE